MSGEGQKPSAEGTGTTPTEQTALNGAEAGIVKHDLRIERFFERYLRHMKGRWAGQPFALEPWQRNDILRPLFGTLQPDGRRQYREALIGLPRKSGKSEIAAGIALYLLAADGEYGAEIYGVAGSRQQATIVFKTAVDMVNASPLLRAACKVYRHVIELPETGSIYRVLSADAKLAHGYNPHGAVIDELHVHPNGELYEALRTGTAARTQPLIVSITTAGASRDGIAWDVYQRGLAKTDPRLFFYWRGAADGSAKDDKESWKQANPASWVSEEFLEDQMRSLPEPVFRRLHLNQWFEEAAASSWLTPEQWESAQGEPIIDPAVPIVLAVDAASRRDTTGVAIAQRGADGTMNVKTWIFKADEQLGYLDYGIIEDFVRDICKDYVVSRLAFDPFQMTAIQMRLANDGLPAETFPQNDIRMVPASQLLFDLIVEGKLRAGNDPALTEQVLAAGIRDTARGWRLEKRKSQKPIDAVVALAMAVQLAEWEAELSGARVIII